MTQAVVLPRLRRAFTDPTGHLVVAQMVVAAAALIVNILAARSLGPSGRGELALLLQIGYLSSIGLLLGVDRSGIAGFRGHSIAATTRAFGRLLVGPSAVGFGVSFLLLVLLAVESDPWWCRLALAAVFAVVNAFVKAVRSISIATERTAEYQYFTVVSQVVLLATLSMLFLKSETNTVWWLTAYIASSLLVNGTLFYRWVRADRTSISYAEITSVRWEGLVLLPSALATSGMLRMDRFLLPIMASTAALGVYASVATMTEILSWPLVAFADSRLGSWRRAADVARLRVRGTFLWVCLYLLIGAVVLVAVLRVTVVPLFGPSFAETLELVPLLVAAAVAFGISRVLSAVLVARRRSDLSSWAEATGFAASIIFYVVLIPPYAARGAAYGSLGGYAVCAIVALVCLLRVRAEAHPQEPRR